MKRQIGNRELHGQEGVTDRMSVRNLTNSRVKEEKIEDDNDEKGQGIDGWQKNKKKEWVDYFRKALQFDMIFPMIQEELGQMNRKPQVGYSL